MNALAKITIAAAAISALCLVPACSSDPNPVDYLNVKGTKANVQINFNVAATRAVGTDEENKISTVNLYVFDNSNTLEQIETDLVITNGIVDIETTSGVKTIYAVSARSLDDIVKGMKLDAFESTIFDATLTNLKNSDGFVMIGKQPNFEVKSSLSHQTSPNKLEMTMTRALAKVQVVYKLMDRDLADNIAALGMRNAQNCTFSIRQSCTSMRIVPNEEDVIDMTSATNNEGTYEGYENSNEWVTASSTPGVQYAAENIVANPTSGNTTFAILRLNVTVKEWNNYNTLKHELEPKSQASSTPVTFYAVGIADKSSGYVDYAAKDKKVIYFSTRSFAEDYAADANDHIIDVELFSDAINASSTPALKKTTRAFGAYEVFEFTDGAVYYRINIEDNVDAEGSKKKAMVKRNTFYTLNVTSVKKLGAPSESYLIPTDPKTLLDFSPESSSWLDTSFDVQQWTENNSDVNL